MSGDPAVRRLLPQNSQMQSFSFTPANFGPRENQKSAQPIYLRLCPYKNCERGLTNFLIDYVFVDEHNRHKRLKGNHLFETVVMICHF
jgi:hypothetical protein